VNLAALVHYTVRDGDRRVMTWLPPVIGIVTCFYIWLHLRWPAKVCGSVWLAAGLLYGACRKGGFRMMRDVSA
jgi:putrescine importer